MARWRKWLIGVFVAALLCAGFIAFILPGIVRSQLEQQVSRATGRTLTVGRISINPLTWSAGLEGVRLSEKGSSLPFVSFSSARVRVSPASVWRLAPVLNDISLAAPRVRIVRTGPNRFNFSDLLEKKPEEKKKEPGEPARFSLNNIVLSNGSIDFRDDALSTPKLHTVRQLLIQIPFVSNIPYLADRYVAPKLTALVNGAPLAFEGKMKPFAKGMEASVAIKLRELEIPFYAAYFPKELPLRVTAGRFSTDLIVNHRLTKGEKPDIAATGTVTLNGIDLRERSGEPLFTLSEGKLAIARIGLLSGEYRAASISLDTPVVTVARNRQGGWNFQRLTDRGNSGKHSTEAGKTRGQTAGKAAQPLIAVGETRVTNGTVRFSDAVPPGGFTAEARQLAITVTGFSSEQGKIANLSLGFTTPRNEQFAASGTLCVTPLAFTVRPVLTNGVVEISYPYLANYLTAPISGRLNASGELSYSAEEGLRIAGGDLQLRQLALSFAPREGIRIPLLAVNGAAYSQKEQSLTVDKVTQQGGEVVISRDASGVFSPARLLKTQPAASVPLPAKQKTRDEKGTPLRFTVKQVTMSGLNASFTDHTREDAPTFTLKKASLSLSDLRGPRMTSMPFRFAAGYGQKGSLKVDGRICPVPFLFKGNVALARIPVLDADPYLPDGVNVVLADGSLDATLALDLTARTAGIGGSFKGSLGVRNFYSLDAEENEDLLKWESLQLDGVSGTLAPFSLQLAGVSLNNYYARVIINRQGVVNLQDLYRPDPAAAVATKPVAAPAVAAPSAAPASAAAAPPNKSIRIDTVTLQDGVLNFTDRHLSREFSTTMVNLGGRVSGLTSEEGKVADVDLRGNLENQSPLRITGRINPLKGDLFLDILIRFSDIELAPMTPYSGTYLGYTVDKGKLTLDLKYLIEQKRLKAENKVFMDQLTFGNAVESDKATRLPVRLAVALLKDRKGEIRLDLPVAGRTDDPDFSIWGVVWQILKNLLVKAATSPFSLLQSMFGGGDDFSGVAFAPGTSRLSAAEEGKLRNLAKALLDRPAIKLELTGFVDRERDAEGYRSELLLKKMKTEKLLALVKEKRDVAGQTTDSAEILPAESSVLLKSVYEKEKFPKPRTIIGTLKSLPDAEMKKLILANTVVGEQQLRALARERAMAVRTFLVNDVKLPQERIFEKSGDIFAPPKQQEMSGSRVEFGAVAQ
ncbi:DUF748 domain-containing protein [Geobacter argillaceus]|uniref:Uncharacterized protein DUF748 n=1 Tax=Geobacter argillaceus TaxID=345631 RepID=A0A562WUC7_9BACT|nr:DUF748 domain-containing protein [Geobacter argillaceus]TWJ33103.1 uncharacterized protein DUF748 [Geobacter argillaceus]